MDMTISPEAAAWFKKELALQSGDSIRLFPRYSSGGGLHPGFSLGIATEAPSRPAVKAEQEGLVFIWRSRISGIWRATACPSFI